MARHIHIPSQADWVSFLANSAEIDNYLVSENELNRVRTESHPRMLALSLTNCCNLLWDFVTSEVSPCPIALADAIDRSLVEGAVGEGLIDAPCDSGYRVKPMRNLILDKRQNTNEQAILPASIFYTKQFLDYDEKIIDYLDRGVVPMWLQTEAATFAWLSQYWIAEWSMYPAANGLTGRFLTNALRLRWSMPLWNVNLKRDSWHSSLQTYSSLWIKNGYFTLLNSAVKPNLTALDLVANSM